MGLEGQTKLARNIFFEVKNILTEDSIPNRENITLKEILKVLKIHPELM